LVLTLRRFRRTLLWSRRELAVVAVAPDVPHAQGRGRAIQAASSSVKAGFGHQDAAQDPSLNPGEAKPATGGSLMEVTPPEIEPGFA
jgi:hypothetical protein